MPKKKKKTKTQEILEDPHVQQWYEDFTYNNSELTGVVYLRRLSSMLKSMEETPESILTLHKDTLYKKMFGYAKREKKRGMTPSYIISEFKALYSYLKEMDVDFKRIPPPKNPKSTPTVKDEIIPSKDELANLLHTASPRNKVSISLMAFSGLRPGVIGDIHGKNGLKMGDLNGWKIQDNEIIFDTPVMITIQPTLSKTSNRYITFLSEEGATHIKNYMDLRIRKGESITNDTPVVSSIFREKVGHISSNAVRDGVRSSMRKAGIQKRPYVLRRYFASMLQEAEHNGVIIHSYCQFMMGHLGDMMTTYTLNKGLTDTQLNDLRESYSKSQRYLQTSTTREELKKTHERMATLENNSKISQEMLFERINRLEKMNDWLKDYIINVQLYKDMCTVEEMEMDEEWQKDHDKTGILWEQWMKEKMEDEFRQWKKEHGFPEKDQ